MSRAPLLARRPAPPVSPSPAEPGIATDLLAWYDRHRRVLPWRAMPGERSDPYRVWLSEIMLQQTTVKAVIPYYRSFLERWSTVEALAAAPVDHVMQAWAGLGYYSRARNLHACAQAVARDHRGRFPDTEAGLRALPGIGAYTAAAIAAIAFGRHAVVVDGNVERVMARLHALQTPFPRAKVEVPALMDAATPRCRTGDFAQAVMDLGATLCTPKNPACAICPLLARCAAARLNLQAELPRRAGKTKVVVRHGLSYFVRRADGAVLVRTRPPTGLLGGMVDLPGSPWALVEGGPPPVPRLPHGGSYAGRVTHTFTHFTLLLDVIGVTDETTVDPALREGCRWEPGDTLDEQALPTLVRTVIRTARANGAVPTPTPRDPGPASRKRRRN